MGGGGLNKSELFDVALLDVSESRWTPTNFILFAEPLNL